jgi:hypothetical protein
VEAQGVIEIYFHSRDPQLFPVVPSGLGIMFNRIRRIILDKFNKDNYFTRKGGDKNEEHAKCNSNRSGLWVTGCVGTRAPTSWGQSWN